MGTKSTDVYASRQPLLIYYTFHHNTKGEELDPEIQSKRKNMNERENATMTIDRYGQMQTLAG